MEYFIRFKSYDQVYQIIIIKIIYCYMICIIKHKKLIVDVFFLSATKRNCIFSVFI